MAAKSDTAVRGTAARADCGSRDGAAGRARRYAREREDACVGEAAFEGEAARIGEEGGGGGGIRWRGRDMYGRSEVKSCAGPARTPRAEGGAGTSRAGPVWTPRAGGGAGTSRAGPVPPCL